MLVMSVAVMAAIGAMGSGMQLVGHSRQRSVGTQVAQERIERIRKTPYKDVELNEDPSHHADPTHPDHYVIGGSNNKFKYELRDGSPQEFLIVDTAPPAQGPDFDSIGSVLHIDDPVEIGGVEFVVYQYVTWVNDPGITGENDYKRIVVVVAWKFPIRTGLTHRVIETTFVSPGNIELTIPTPTPTTSPGPTGSAPTPEVSSPPGCGGDTQPPSSSGITVLSGSGAATGYTNSTGVQVVLEAEDNCNEVAAQLSNTGSPSSFVPVATLQNSPPAEVAWQPVTVAWTIPAGNGTKVVYGRYVDGIGNVSPVFTATVVLDQTDPPKPLNFAKQSCSMDGSDRTITFIWTAGTPADTNHLAYRVYRSIENGTWQVAGTPTVTTITDTQRKNLTSLRYYVVAFDRAGNESLDSNLLSFPKNSCG